MYDKCERRPIRILQWHTTFSHHFKKTKVQRLSTAAQDLYQLLRPPPGGRRKLWYGLAVDELWLQFGNRAPSLSHNNTAAAKRYYYTHTHDYKTHHRNRFKKYIFNFVLLFVYYCLFCFNNNKMLVLVYYLCTISIMIVA